MKTKDQVTKYLSLCRFTDDDWAIVRQHIKEEFNYNFHRATKPKVSATRDQFFEWEESGIGTGDIVVFDGKLGIVSVNVPGLFVIAGYIGNERLILQELHIEDAVLADEDQAKYFMSVLEENNITFITRYGMLEQGKTVIKSEKPKQVTLRHRNKPGEKYWYITDKFSVKIGVDQGPTSSVTNMRFERGNYFTTIKEAIDFLNTLIKLRN